MHGLSSLDARTDFAGRADALAGAAMRASSRASSVSSSALVRRGWAREDVLSLVEGILYKVLFGNVCWVSERVASNV